VSEEDQLPGSRTPKKPRQLLIRNNASLNLTTKRTKEEKAEKQNRGID